LQLLFKHIGHITSFNHLPAQGHKFGEMLLFSVKSLISCLHAYTFHIMYDLRFVVTKWIHMND